MDLRFGVKRSKTLVLQKDKVTHCNITGIPILIMCLDKSGDTNVTQSEKAEWQMHTFVISDGDLVLTSSALVNRSHIQNAVSVQVKGHFNLRHTSRRRRNSTQFKLAEEIIVLRHGTLALVDLDQHARLVVRVRCERLRLFGRDRCVTFDQRRHHTASCLNTKRQWSHVQQQQVLYGLRLVSMQDCCLYSCNENKLNTMMDGNLNSDSQILKNHSPPTSNCHCQAHREPQRGPGNHYRGGLSQVSVCAEMETLTVRLGVCGSIVSSTSRVRGQAPAENGFYAYLRSERSHLEQPFQYV